MTTNHQYSTLRFHSGSNTERSRMCPTWVEIDLKAIQYNYLQLKRLAQKQFLRSLYKRRLNEDINKFPEILAVIKADAYGHGMLKVASLLQRMGVTFFGVSDLTEGILLRKNGIKKPILIFESTLSQFAKEVIDYNLTPSVCTLSLASALNTYAQSINRKVDIHVNVDTGMSRLGVWHEEAEDFIGQVMKFTFLSIKGIYTHFPLADTNPRFTKNQVKLLFQLVNRLDKEALIIPYVHAANSLGLVGYKTYILNLARPGLMLYGLYPTEKFKEKIDLKPALSVKTRIIFLKQIRKGRGISYGHTFVAPRNMTIATLPIGYNDGYLRSFSNKAKVLIAGQYCPVVGRVTMDQMMVDVTSVPLVRLGTEVTVLGTQDNKHISADDLAKLANTINYEIVCSLGNRLPRVYKK